MGMKVIVIQLERVVGWFESAFGTPVRPRTGGLSDSGRKQRKPLSVRITLSKPSFPTNAHPNRAGLSPHAGRRNVHEAHL